MLVVVKYGSYGGLNFASSNHADMCIARVNAELSEQDPMLDCAQMHHDYEYL
jgi:hypothetical protein